MKAQLLALKVGLKNNFYFHNQQKIKKIET